LHITLPGFAAPAVSGRASGGKVTVAGLDEVDIDMDALLG
jgi:hypothetical protein